MTKSEGHLLIVDDEPALRKALRTSLVATGFTIAEARDGAEAIDTLRRSPADLVLLDINMPGMTGIEACRRIRSSNTQIGIVMVTVRESEEDKVDGFAAAIRRSAS